MDPLSVVVVTGLSGAGRTTALRVLEDLGFYCVDNLPPSLSAQLMELVDTREVERVGLGIDVRMGAFLDGAEQALRDLEAQGHRVEVLFLDCADEVLVRRFSETRRPHQLARGGDLLAAIGREREQLGGLRHLARHVFDTTNMTVHDLRRELVEHLTRGAGGRGMVVRVVSFGFKYGLPVDADLVFDLRYLPNPHFVPALRPRAGTDPEVAAYVLESDETQQLLGDIETLLVHSIPRYEAEGKAYLTVALGCTGGRHRSVALAEEIARRIGEGRDVVIHHRDVERVKS